MVASSTMDTLWRRRTRVGLLALLITLALFGGHPEDISRLGAASVGLLLGPLIVGRSARVRAGQALAARVGYWSRWSWRPRRSVRRWLPCRRMRSDPSRCSGAFRGVPYTPGEVANCARRRPAATTAAVVNWICGSPASGRRS